MEFSNISVQFAGLKALTDVSFSVEEGEIKAVIGPNGAGKSTLFNVITGYVRPVSGRVSFAGRDVIGLRPHVAGALVGRRRITQGGAGRNPGRAAPPSGDGTIRSEGPAGCRPLLGTAAA